MRGQLVAGSGTAVTQAPLTDGADELDTVPVISPSGCSAALMDEVVALTVTVTGVAFALVERAVIPLGREPRRGENAQRVAEVDLVTAGRQSGGLVAAVGAGEGE